MFKQGSILKVGVKNFITFKHIEFEPGPNLNLILGPNGSGKSTLIAAVVLGLGGTPKIIGRGSYVSEYVKHNCTQSCIEIVLQGHDDCSNVIITRVFDIHNKNIWTINGERVTKDDIINCVKKFNIQIDNLCQFLPQDRVQDFAKLNKQQLLKETQIALGRTDLVDKQKKASESSTLYLTKINDINKNKILLAEMETKSCQLAVHLERAKEKKKHLTKMKHIDGKIAWMKFEDYESEYNSALQDKENAKKAYEKVRKYESAVPKTIEKIKNWLTLISKKLSIQDVKITKIRKNLVSNFEQITSLTENIKIEESKALHINSLKLINEEIKLIEIQIKQLECEKKELIELHGEDMHIGEKLARYYGDVKKLVTDIRTCENKKNSLIYQNKEHINELKLLKEQYASIQNTYEKKKNWLKMKFQDAYKATVWLEENKDKFKGHIYKPMILEINVFDSQNAKYFENVISMKDRIAFTCVLVDDMNLLIKIAEKQKFNINVVHSHSTANINNYQPRIPIEQLRQYDFWAYMNSLYEAPEPIMTYLCKTYNLHNIPIGSELTTKYFNEIPKQIGLFFTDKLRFSFNYSTYSGEKITTQSNIRSDGSFAMTINSSHVETIIGKTRVIEEQLRENDESIKSIQEEAAILANQKAKLNVEINQLESIRKSIQSINFNIDITRKKLKDKKNLKVDCDNIKENAKKKIRGYLKTIIELLENCEKLRKDLFESVFCFKLLAEKRTSVSKDHLVLQNKLSVILNSINQAKSTLNNKIEALESVKNNRNIAYTKAKETTDGYDKNDKEFKVYEVAFQKLPNTIDELLNKKQIALSCANLIKNDEVDGLQDYDMLLTHIANKKNQIENDLAEKQRLYDKLKIDSRKWLTPVNEFIEEINEKFTSYFEKIGCLGNISLDTGECVDDYGEYGLSIKVSFRSHIPLQELCNNVHSGGERAVTTALYMLSLQGLTSVPFRCVDEINQGMDEANERAVYKLLFQITKSNDTPQYFVVTPKLLPDMEYTDTMKIHVIYDIVNTLDSTVNDK